MAAHPAIGRFKTGHTVGHGWITYRAAGIGADSGETETCRHGREPVLSRPPTALFPGVLESVRIVGRQSAFCRLICPVTAPHPASALPLR